MKRYTVKVDFYIYAKNDADAMAKAEAFAKEQRDKHDDRTEVLEIHETPFACADFREVYNKNNK